MSEKVLTTRLILICQNCRKVFKYRLGKKYCSQKCSKSAENKRFYNRNKEILKKDKREAIQKDREVYKKYGIKK